MENEGIEKLLEYISKDIRQKSMGIVLMILREENSSSGKFADSLIKVLKAMVETYHAH